MRLGYIHSVEILTKEDRKIITNPKSPPKCISEMGFCVCLHFQQDDCC